MVLIIALFNDRGRCLHDILSGTTVVLTNPDLWPKFDGRVTFWLMTSQRKPNLFSFFRSGPMPCPYLRGKVEQQLFTDLSGLGAQSRYEILSQAGFRRSHHIAYRPACRGCAACIPIRVVASEFKLSRNWRRILNKNSDLTVDDKGTFVSDEQFALFSRYMKLLSLIARACAEKLPYVYLGFWVADSPKMHYKIRLQPTEGFSSNGWHPLPESQGLPPGIETI